MKYPTTCWLLLLVFGLSAQTPSPDNLIPRTLFFKEKTKSNVRLSLDGNSIFYQKKADGSDSTLYYVQENLPLHEKKRQFDGKLAYWHLLHEGGLMVVLQRGNDLELYSTSLTSSKLRKVNFFPFKRLSVVNLSSRFPNKIAADIEAVDPMQSGLYILDLLSGSTKRLGLMDGMEQVFLDENFGLVAALRNDSNMVRTLLRRQGGQWEVAIQYPFTPDYFIGGVSRIVSVSDDGKTIYATDNHGKDKSSLVAISAETGELTELASDPDADIFPAGYTLDPAGKPTSVVALYANTRRHILDEGVRADFEFLDKELKGNTSFVGASKNDSTWLVRKLDGGPAQFYRYDRKAKKLTTLFNDFNHLDDYDLPTRTAFTVTTRDGVKLPVHVYVPFGMSRADGTTKTPVAHGRLRPRWALGRRHALEQLVPQPLLSTVGQPGIRGHQHGVPGHHRAGQKDDRRRGQAVGRGHALRHRGRGHLGHQAGHCQPQQARHLGLVLWRLCRKFCDGRCARPFQVRRFDVRHRRPARLLPNARSRQRQPALAAPCRRPKHGRGPCAIEKTFSQHLYQGYSQPHTAHARQPRRPGAAGAVGQVCLGAERRQKGGGLFLLPKRRPRLSAARKLGLVLGHCRAFFEQKPRWPQGTPR